ARTSSRPFMVPTACSTYTTSGEYCSTQGSQSRVCAARSTVTSNCSNAADNSSRGNVLLLTPRTRTRSTYLCRGWVVSSNGVKALFGLVFALIVVVGCTSKPHDADADAAGLVDIGDGLKLYLNCQGSGSPT